MRRKQGNSPGCYFEKEKRTAIALQGHNGRIADIRKNGIFQFSLPD
jgi:hypothetical protein